MDIRQLQCFIAVAEQRNFGRAAAIIGIAPSALSAQIANLENDLGVTLFERSSQRVELTHVGSIVLPQARTAVNEFDLTIDAAHRAQRGEIGQVHVAYARALPWFLPGRLITPFTASHPNVHVDLREVSTQLQPPSILDGTLDAGIAIAPIDDDHLAKKLVWQEPVFVVCGPTHRFAGRDGVSVHELREEPLVMPSYAFSPEAFSSLLEMCRAAGFAPRVSFEVDEVRVLWGLVTSGKGVAFGYRSFFASNIPGLVFLPVIDTEVHMDFYVIWNALTENALRDAFLASLPPYSPEAGEWFPAKT